MFQDDLKLWLPSTDSPPDDLDLETSRFLLKQVGDHFCNLLVQERDTNNEHMSEGIFRKSHLFYFLTNSFTDKTIAWKRVVQGVREMCDVCETTLFNFHWACGKCGFVVCLDCYKVSCTFNLKRKFALLLLLLNCRVAKMVRLKFGASLEKTGMIFRGYFAPIDKHMNKKS